MKKNKIDKKEVYNNILFSLNHELLISSEQLKLITYNLIKRDYNAQDNYEYNEIEEKVDKKLNNTNNKDLIKLRELFNTIEHIKYSFSKNNEAYIENEKKLNKN